MKRTTMDEEAYLHGTEHSYGICSACGEVTAGGCEPDMVDGECEYCGAYAVIGFENALCCGIIDLE